MFAMTVVSLQTAEEFLNHHAGCRFLSFFSFCFCQDCSFDSEIAVRPLRSLFSVGFPARIDFSGGTWMPFYFCNWTMCDLQSVYLFFSFIVLGIDTSLLDVAGRIASDALPVVIFLQGGVVRRAVLYKIGHGLFFFLFLIFYPLVVVPLAFRTTLWIVFPCATALKSVTTKCRAHLPRVGQQNKK